MFKLQASYIPSSFQTMSCKKADVKIPPKEGPGNKPKTCDEFGRGGPAGEEGPHRESAQLLGSERRERGHMLVLAVMRRGRFGPFSDLQHLPRYTFQQYCPLTRHGDSVSPLMQRIPVRKALLARLLVQPRFYRVGRGHPLLVVYPWNAVAPPDHMEAIGHRLLARAYR